MADISISPNKDQIVTRELRMEGGRLKLPTMFPSVSSHETQLTPLDAIKVLSLFGARLALISAYDLSPARRQTGIIAAISELHEQGCFIVVDSGNYEASRSGDSSWKPSNLGSALAEVPHEWLFCFDVLRPSLDRENAVKEIVAAVEREQKITRARVLPIIHAPPLSNGYELKDVPWIAREIADRIRPPLIAIPERELGAGLVARARTVSRIREELDRLPFYQPLHLLGTGNPWSLTVLAAAGADSFDGLEWCRMTIDRESGQLNHFHNFDFYMYQARLATSHVVTSALTNDDVAFSGKVAFHNLDYYLELVDRLRVAAINNGFGALATDLMGKANVVQLSQQVPGLFR